jgi:hypothetical protein
VTAALQWGKPAASETAATTMDLTSSATMTALTGVAALLRHIAAAGCRTKLRQATPLRMWGCTNPCKGDNIFVELLQRDGANDAFAYIGGTIMERVGVCIIT